MTSPRYMPPIAYADAWTPSVPGVATGRAVYVGHKTAAEIQAMAGQLRGAIVLSRLPQESFMDADRPQPGLSDQPVRTGGPGIPPVQSAAPAGELLALLQRAGAAVVLKPSAYRDGTVGVVGNRMTPSDAVPSITFAAEQYNMLARLAAAGTPPEIRIELRTRYHEDDLNTCNVLADLPGSDPALRDQIVLVGAHLDSWQTGSGATDNGDGVAAVMEAMRILAAVGAQPRRTIRVALLSGEEQGVLGARAYIQRHFADPAARDRLAVYLNDDPGRRQRDQGLRRLRRAHPPHQRGLPRMHERGRAAGVGDRDGGLRVASGPAGCANPARTRELKANENDPNANDPNDPNAPNDPND